MSYEMCNRITVKKKTNQIFVNVASNNVFPHDYHRCEYAKNSNYTLDDKLRFLMLSMLDGNIQITQINKNTVPYEYAMMKVREYQRDNNINDFEEKYEKRHELFKEEIKRYTDPDNWEVYKEFRKNNKELIDNIEKEIISKLYEKEFEVFKQSISEKIEGKYYITNESGNKIEFCGKTKYGFKYREYRYLHQDCLLDYKLAYIRKDYMGDKYKIEKLEEQQLEKSTEEDMEEEQYAG